MNRHCEKCGQEYNIGPISFDDGLCRSCAPGFFGVPIWFQSCQAGTRNLWRNLLAVHIILCFLSKMILDCGETTVPVGIYCLTVLLYIGVRSVIGRLRGYPVLTRSQAILFALLPVCGPVLFTAAFNGGQLIRYGM